MNFSTASKVLETIRAGDEVEFIRGENRVKINNAANCAPPLDAELAKKLGIKINVNWGELMILLAHARRQYLTAFMSNQYFFKVTLPLAPAEYQSEWGAFITEQINRPLRNSLKYFEVHRSKWSAVVCHGVGPLMWYSKDKWCPDFVAIEDVRIPTDTTLDFENLDYVAFRHIYTPYELVNEVFNGKRNNRWKKKAIARILQNYKQINVDYAANHYDWETTPEKLAELVKQDGGYYSSTAVPGIPLYHFYFKDTLGAGKHGWFMRVVPETGAITGGAPQDDFLWESEEPVADAREEFFHCQFGDLNNKAPFLYHSVRSLGFALLEPTFYTNLTRCRLLQHIHDNFNIWLQITDPAEKARPQIQEFANLGVLRSGMSIVPQASRHQIEADLVEMGMSQLKQLQQEASSTYTQQLDTGTKKEQTAFETSVKMQQVNAMLSGLLMVAFKYASFEYMEIARRFCMFKTTDPDVQKFQKRCKEAGIPRQWLNVNHWDVEPVTPIGMGNPTIALSSAQQLMGARSMYDSQAQQEILHDFTLVTTGDARKAARWAPLNRENSITNSKRDAQLLFGTLMQGVPVPPRPELSPIDQCEAMLPLMAGKITFMEQRDNMATPDEAHGLATVTQYIGQLIQTIAQNPQEKQRAKQYSDMLGKMNNDLKGMIQRAAEAQKANAQQQGGLSPEAQAKIHAITATAAANVHAKEMANNQKMKQNQQKFIRQQRRDDAKAFAEIQRDNTKHQYAAFNEPEE